MERREPVMAPAEAGMVEKRTPRSIRLYDPEGGRIEAFAGKRGLAAAGSVRFAARAALEGETTVDENGDRLAPLIERIFLYSCMMATKMRNDMRGAGHGSKWRRRSVRRACCRTNCWQTPRAESNRANEEAVGPSAAAHDGRVAGVRSWPWNICAEGVVW